MNKHYKYIIIGAGLSGLTTAYQLLKQGETDLVVLEARASFGGRVCTENGIDLGATWFQSYHSDLVELLAELNLTSFDQYSQGDHVLVYSSMVPPHQFQTPANQPAARRIGGGSIALLDALAEKSKDFIQYQRVVSAIREVGEQLEVVVGDDVLTAQRVVCTLPPKLAMELNLEPELPRPLVQFLSKTHTWMSNSIKIGLTYAVPFWREKGYSGTLLGQNSPVMELYDHSAIDDSTYSLMGFGSEGLRTMNREDRKAKILEHISKYLGDEAMNYLIYSEKDWSFDPFTSTQTTESTYMHPQYGHPVFNQFHLQGKLLFSGTETASEYGGYMEGAIRSGLRSARLLVG